MSHLDLEITAELVRDLLRAQHPDLADRPVRLGARGWDNQLWRLGDDLAVRLPWVTGDGSGSVRNEHAWVPHLAPRLPLPVPVPQRLGTPSERFPRPWIVTTWVEGAPADAAPITRATESAASLAAFLTALHQPAPHGAPASRDGRGGRLTAGGAGVVRGIARAADRGLVDDPDAVAAVWQDAVAAPGWDGPPTWIHADLHPANVLTADGALAGVVDFGDLCAGDPACDLAAAWILLPDGALDAFHAAYRPAADAATRRRARGWAVWRALGCIHIANDPGPGGKPSWGPPAQASLKRLLAAPGWN
jgi:aminoglycoside phosphotransferase (APT) family kinase protein